MTLCLRCAAYLQVSFRDVEYRATSARGGGRGNGDLKITIIQVQEDTQSTFKSMWIMMWISYFNVFQVYFILNDILW